MEPEARYSHISDAGLRAALQLLDRHSPPDREQEARMDEILTQLRLDLLCEEEAAQELRREFGWPMDRSNAEIVAFLR